MMRKLIIFIALVTSSVFAKQLIYKRAQSAPYKKASYDLVYKKQSNECIEKRKVLSGPFSGSELKKRVSLEKCKLFVDARSLGRCKVRKKRTHRSVRGPYRFVKKYIERTSRCECIETKIAKSAPYSKSETRSIVDPYLCEKYFN